MWSISTGKAKSNSVKNPRRLRRGFSMVEMTLTLIVTAIILQTGIELATSHTKRQITQRTAATLSRVADDVETYMSQNYFNLILQLDPAPHVIEIDWSTLIDGNLISLDSLPTSPDRGTVRLFFTQRSDTIYAVIMSFDGRGSQFSPRPDSNTRFAGKVQSIAPNTLNGWDFSLAIPEIATLSEEDLEGNIGVMRYIALDVNVNPYLHRIPIPGRLDLNTMGADLDLGGFDIENTLNITTGDLVVQDQITVSGTITAETITLTGDATIGNLETETAEIRGNLTADNARIAGNLETETAEIRGNLITENLEVEGNASFERLSATTFTGGSVVLDIGTYNEIIANEINADQVIIGD